MKELEFPTISLTYRSKIQWINFQIRVCSRSKFYRDISLDQKIVVEKPKRNKCTVTSNKNLKNVLQQLEYLFVFEIYLHY